MLTISGAFMVRTVSLNIVLFKANAFATKLGEPQMAAHSIAMQIWMFASFMLDGYANAGLALSGKLLAEKRIIALKQLTKTLLIIGVLISLLAVQFMIFWYSDIGNWFTDDFEVLSIFNTIFIFVIISQPINAVAFTYDGILKGIAAAKFIRNLMIFAAITFFISLEILSRNFELNISALWLALIFWMIIRAVIPPFYIKRRFS